MDVLMDLSVLALHKHPEYLQDCCDLLNSEWKRSNTARLRSLESSCDQLPVCLILLKGKKLLGHLKLASIPSIKDGCFVESVVIAHHERGKGYGTILMDSAEKYCQSHLNLNVIYLSTKGQEGFYSKLGYIECKPISIYGGATASTSVDQTSSNKSGIKLNGTTMLQNAPTAPPLPQVNWGTVTTSKTYMKKNLKNIQGDS